MSNAPDVSMARNHYEACNDRLASSILNQLVKNNGDCTMFEDKSMKCLSVRQPWAWALFHGKDIENRTWATKYRGDLLIHAGKTIDMYGARWIDEHFPNLKIDQMPTMPLGAIIGRVTMTGCVYRSDSPWFFGPYGFALENPFLFENPIPYRGTLKLFDVPDELIVEK